jgi:lysophospholipase L1-like esterase
VPTFRRYVAIGDSSTEGLEDPDGAGGYRGWANRLAERIAALQGGLLYANLAVRGKRAREIREEQLAPALAMKADLASVFAGSNDMLDRGFRPDALRHELARMYGALAAAGATVLTFTLPDLTGVMPIGRLIARRLRAMNAAMRDAAAETGARLVDFAAIPVSSDRRFWSDDRFHVNSDGHERMSVALAQALGLPGADDSWKRPFDGVAPKGPLARFSEDVAWCGRHLIGRAITGRRDVSALRPKRPLLLPV